MYLKHYMNIQKYCIKRLEKKLNPSLWDTVCAYMYTYIQNICML